MDAITITEALERYAYMDTPERFYRDIFPEGELETKGIYEDGKYNAIAVCIGKDRKIKRLTVTDDLEAIGQMGQTDDFCLMSPITYAGKSRKSINARYLYALAIDVDGIRTRPVEFNEPEGIVTMFWQFDGHGPSNYLPLPTFIVSSGTGIHVYYVFERPIPLYRNIVKQLEKLKRRLTWMYWTQGITDREHQAHIQYESLFQGFRVPGTITKNGGRAKVFWVDDGTKVDLEYLNKFVPEEYRVQDIAYKSNLTLEQAKKKYPDWYKRRIEEKRPKGTWQNDRALYDWWKRQIEAGAEDGHRYWSIMTLAVYAVKCGIPRKELEADAMGYIDLLNERGKRPDNPFTEDDVLAALEAYNSAYITYPVDTIEARTGIKMPRNKRNGRKQAVHLKIARQTLAILNEDNGKALQGRPSKQRIVWTWQRSHPEGRKADCIRETGLSKPTVYKYWQGP